MEVARTVHRLFCAFDRAVTKIGMFKVWPQSQVSTIGCLATRVFTFLWGVRTGTPASFCTGGNLLVPFLVLIC